MFRMQQDLERKRPENQGTKKARYIAQKVMMKGKMLKVNCSFCGKEIECPEDMINSEKHSCSECFEKLKDNQSGEETGKIHVDVPPEKFDEMLPEVMTNSLVKEVFPDIWKERKQELKQVSKKQLAEEMFSAGAYIAISNMIQVIHKQEKDNSTAG